MSDAVDWEASIERYRADLIRSVTWLFTWLKLEVGGSIETLPAHKRFAVLFVLRPAESALRRLIYVGTFVYDLSAPSTANPGARTSPYKPHTGSGEKRSKAMPFKLIDPRKRFDLFPNRPKYRRGPGPRITALGYDDRDRSDLYAEQERRRALAERDFSPARLCARMNAVMAALEDLPAQAQRLVNLKARMKRRQERTGKPALGVIRPGAPPGYRRRHRHEVDEILLECQQLALMAMRELDDTS